MSTNPNFDNVTVTPWPDEGTGYATQPAINYWWNTYFEPEPCSCGRSTRHLWLTHWFRIFFMQERWP